MIPYISIVIPTFNRNELLGRLLLSLRQQDIDASWYEILVVSDGPDFQTTALVRKLNMNGYHNLRHLTLPEKAGPAAARNMGWQNARADLIAFTDDDCIASPSWAGTFIESWHNDLVIAFTGKVEVPLSSRPTDHETNTAGLETAEFITANCCCTKLALERVGGFDEQFKMAWREDSDLHFSLLEKNIPVVRIDSALVIHPVRKVTWGTSLREQKKSLYDALLYKKHKLLYRERIATGPPLLYYGMIALFLSAIIVVVWFNAGFLLLAWLALVFYFAGLRLRNTSRAPSHLVEMLFTSALIPFLSVYWRLRGAIRFQTFFI